MCDERTYGSADKDGPTRLWFDADGEILIGPLKTDHNFHYAKIVSRQGTLSFCRSSAKMSGTDDLIPLPFLVTVEKLTLVPPGR